MLHKISRRQGLGPVGRARKTGERGLLGDVTVPAAGRRPDKSRAGPKTMDADTDTDIDPD